MKTKSEITADYISIVSQINDKIEEYETYLITRYDAICELSTGNRGIEEIEEELANMKSIVSYIRTENEYMMATLRQNEYKC